MISEFVRARQAPLARRAVALDADPAAAGQARRALRGVLDGTGRDAWLESAEVACTELVSNAVLHAHTGVELTIEVYEDLLYVAVRDRSPVLPVQRDYDSQATTGRGLSLVAALVTEHGVADAGPDGKTMWFTISGEPGEESEEELLAAWAGAEWNLDELDDDGPASPALQHEVMLRALPPTLWLAARQHHDALIRELVLYQAAHGGPDVDVAAADRARAIISTSVWAAVERAQEAGSARAPVPEGHPSPLPWVPGPLDLALRVPEDMAGAFAALQDALDAAERLAVAGQLLARPGLPEIVAVRDWACEQVVSQLAGVSPSPWPGTAQQRFTEEVHARDDDHLSEFDVASVRDADRGLVAVDDTNRIVAISAPLARLVGWDTADLVGRRVVALIPPRFREAHVAGFTRHLTTGEAHVLGVSLTLPVLHSDGTEILCEFMIGLASAGNSRSVYVAQIEPTPFSMPG